MSEAGMVTRTSRSPSPAPAPPTAAAPGPRAAHLLKLYANAVSHTLETCSYARFAECFPTPAANAPHAMEAFHKEFVDKLAEQCREHFDAILVERNVVPALNDLDRLVEDARKRKAKAAEVASDGGPVQAPAPPHTLPAASLALSRLSPALIDEESRLGQELETLQHKNENLLVTVMQQRREAEGLMSGLESIVGDLDESLASLQHDEMLALTNEAVEMDQMITTFG